MRRSNLAFMAYATIGFLVCHFMGGIILPSSWKASAPIVPDRSSWYVSTYNDIGLDYYVVRFGLWGVAEHIKKADIICSSSSKGMYGFDAKLLTEKLSTPGHPVRVYNLSFGFGEGFGYLMEVIKTLDLRDKILLADMTDNTADYHLTPMARVALETPTWFEGYKVFLEKWLTYERDHLLQGRLPRVAYSSEKGFRVTPYLSTGQNFRHKETGNVNAVEAKHPHQPRAGRYSFDFQFDHLREPFFEECRKRNIRIIFTSIPAEGYDPEWGKYWAQRTGNHPHVTVDPVGIELYDLVHMSANGRKVFSTRLADALLAHDTAADMIRSLNGVAPRAENRE